MSVEDLDRVAVAAHRDVPATLAGLPASVESTDELRAAVASAIGNGESLAAVAASADMPALAALDVLESSHLHAMLAAPTNPS